jgi:hypothetical protein
MRIESNDSRNRLPGRGAFDYLPKYFLMSEMQAIEIANGKHGATSGTAILGRPLRSGPEYGEGAHAATSKLRPS